MLLNQMSCCNTQLECEVHIIQEHVYLVVANCKKCKTKIAEIREKRNNEVKLIRRFKGKEAKKIIHKYLDDKNRVKYRTKSGTKAKEYEFYNRYGTIYNSNNIRIAKQEDFLKFDIKEINKILNSKITLKF